MTGAIVWFTGLPSSGKTTLARSVQRRLAADNRPAVVLDSDELRDILGQHAYTPDGRAQFYRSLAALAVVLANQQLITLVAATAPHRADRDRARAALPAPLRFVEVWVDTPLSLCESRDPKQLYARARAGDAPDLPGVGVAYEPPLSPEVVAHPEHDRDDDTFAAILDRLR